MIVCTAGHAVYLYGGTGVLTVRHWKPAYELEEFEFICGMLVTADLAWGLNRRLFQLLMRIWLVIC